MLLILGIISIIIIVIVAAVILIYNGLISKRNRVQDAWAQIDVQLKRRYDLIPITSTTSISMPPFLPSPSNPKKNIFLTKAPTPMLLLQEEIRKYQLL